jgi:hypothetical protein
MWANSASATRSSSQRSDSPSVRRNRIERCQRLAPRTPASAPLRLTSLTCIDAEPSCSTTKSTPAVRMSAVEVCGRASATMVSASAPMRHSQNRSSPSHGRRSRTGISRRRRNADTSLRRTHAWRSHSSSSRAGAPSSGRYCGAPKVMGGRVNMETG